MSLQIPDKSKYSEKVYEISEIFKKLVSNATTAVGTGIYELVIRPISAIYAAITENIEQWHREYTLDALSGSDNREVGPADSILSNYFITRRDGKQASAIITVYSKDTLTKVPQGSAFSIDSISMYATDTVYGSYTVMEDVYDNEGVYAKAHKSGEFYCFPVHVKTSGSSPDVIAEGASVNVVSYIPGVDHAVLSSALEGGSEVETDASMVSRAKDTVLSWIGSSNTIHKILNTSGFTLYSSKSFGGNSPEMNRASGSDLFLNTAGMIDTYVKTAVYPMSNTVIIDTKGSTSLDITDRIHAGALKVSSVIGEDGKNIPYSVNWGSSDPTITPEGARLSVYQTVELNLHSAHNTVSVTYLYMPYIAELQKHINKPENRLLGWDVLVKSAVPAVLSIRGSLSGTPDDINKLTSDIVSYINSKPVGYTTINLSDIQEIVHRSQGVFMESPVVMSATCIGYDGGAYSCTDSSGELDIHGRAPVTGNVMFVCVETSGVSIE